MKVKGVVSLSVCNVHKRKDSSSELVTQALQGMPVDIIKFDIWYKVKLGDGYIGWVHPLAIVNLNEDEFILWAQAPKIIILKHYGFSYEVPDINSQCVSDIVSGNRFKVISDKGDFYEVSYPNGKTAYIEKDMAMLESEWLDMFNNKTNGVLNIAFSLYGIPYLWGGTSSKGVDCSGFVKLCFSLCNIDLPRDAYQQSSIGKVVNIDMGLDALSPCDLLFFGERGSDSVEDKIDHVAIYVGNGKYIHSQGYVHVNSLLEADVDYDLYNKKRLLLAKRVII